MNKVIILVSIVLLQSIVVLAQEKKLYNPGENATEAIDAAILQAAATNKFVLIQAGGNWCGWCIEFHRFCQADPVIDSIIQSSFVLYHLNWSKENENKPLFTKFEFPQRFGFPVFIILDAKGQRLHTQNSEYLEDGKKSYDREKVISFLSNWSPAALESKQYSGG